MERMIERRNVADEKTLKSHIGAVGAGACVEARPAWVRKSIYAVVATAWRRRRGSCTLKYGSSRLLLYCASRVFLNFLTLSASYQGLSQKWSACGLSLENGDEGSCLKVGTMMSLA